MSGTARPQIALWFRYGPGEHSELFHAMPEIVERLSREVDVHYFGLRSKKPVPALIARHAKVHLLPFHVDRTSTRDKFVKTAIWLLCLPWIGLRCRLMGVDAVYIDETVPLTTTLARVFFGKQVAVSVVDFFVDIYFGGSAPRRALARWIRARDLAAWRKLPLIFTRAKYTRKWLVEQGVNAAIVHPVYDPCDLTIYRPAGRDAARAKYGYAADHVVLVHHGILHPNKGNDLIIRALAETRDTLPHVRYLLVGDGTEMNNLRKLVDELKMTDRIQFTGWLKTLEEVNLALNAGDIGLVMRVGQESDNFHMTGALVHSLACGLPVLAAQLGGVLEVVREDENGLLFPAQDMSQFKLQLAKLANSAELRRRLGVRALETAREQFDMGRVVEATAVPLIQLARDGAK